MFPKNRINIIYRILCLLSFAVVIIMINSTITLSLLFFTYCILALSEKNFRNIEFVVVTFVLLLICYWLDNYILLKIMLLIDYAFYFLDTAYYIDDLEEVKISKKDYVRFVNKKEKKKGTNNITAIYITLHLVLLVIAIVVG